MDSHISAKVASPKPACERGQSRGASSPRRRCPRCSPPIRAQSPAGSILPSPALRSRSRPERHKTRWPVSSPRARAARISLASWMSSSMTSAEARICSYECTFCADCVETKLHNVCPNCGGGFVPRPVRPATEWRPSVSVKRRPPSTKRIHLSYSLDDIARHTARTFPSEQR